MSRKQPIWTSDTILFLLLVSNAIVLKNGFIKHAQWYWLLSVTVPLLVLFFVNRRYGDIFFINKKGKFMQSKIHELLLRANDLGIEYDLSFSCQEVLEGCVLGLDGKHRRLLIVEKNENSSIKNFIIDLDEVRSCTLKKSYRSIRAGELKTRAVEEYLDMIILQLEFYDQRKPVEISFYKYSDQTRIKTSESNRKARNWQIMISKMLRNQLKSIA